MFSTFSLNIFSLRLGHRIKTNVGPRYDQFKFSEKGRGPVSRPYYVYEFSRKLFLMLYSINWPKLNLIVWLPLLLEILGNMRTAIVCQL